MMKSQKAGVFIPIVQVRKLSAGDFRWLRHDDTSSWDLNMGLSKTFIRDIKGGDDGKNPEDSN